MCYIKNTSYYFLIFNLFFIHISVILSHFTYSHSHIKIYKSITEQNLNTKTAQLITYSSTPPQIPATRHTKIIYLVTTHTNILQLFLIIQITTLHKNNSDDCMLKLNNISDNHMSLRSCVHIPFPYIISYQIPTYLIILNNNLNTGYYTQCHK